MLALCACLLALYGRFESRPQTDDDGPYEVSMENLTYFLETRKVGLTVFR